MFAVTSTCFGELPILYPEFDFTTLWKSGSYEPGPGFFSILEGVARDKTRAVGICYD